MSNGIPIRRKQVGIHKKRHPGIMKRRTGIPIVRRVSITVSRG